MTGTPEKVVPLNANQSSNQPLNQPLGVQHEYIPLSPESGGTGGAVGGDGGMNERIGKLEGAIEGLKHSQNLVFGALAVVATLVAGFGVYSLSRLDRLDEKVSAVPDKVSADVRDLTKTLAATITASKQQAPQVILLPAPSQSTGKEGKGPRN